MNVKSARGAVLAFAGAISVCVAACPAAAQTRHHRHRHELMRGQEAYAPAQRRDPYEFYPNEIEGGVSGNLPFNNQIRKMTDPLNANGAGK